MRVALFFLLIFYATADWQSDIYVDNVHGSDTNNGTVNFPYSTIARALQARPDTIYVVPNNGVNTPYSGVNNTNLSYDLQNQTITIQSTISGTKFYVNMYGNGRFIHVYNSLDADDRCINMTIIDALFMNGDTDENSYYDQYYQHDNNGYGGAIFAANCSLGLQDVTFYLCSAAYGGAIAFIGDREYVDMTGDTKFRLKASNCKFQFNTAEYGGAIYLSGNPNIFRYAAIRSSQNLYESNEASINGGVIYVTGQSDAKFTSDAFNDNDAAVDGGVLYVTGYSHVEFHTSAMDSNSASTGKGGVVCADNHGASMFYGCSFCSNFAALNGSVAYIPVPFHTVLDKPTNYFQCNVGQFPFCVGTDCQQIYFPKTSDYFEYLPDGQCNACVAPSRKKRTGAAIVKPCVIQSTGTDTPGCGVASNVSCATILYAYTNQGCDEWRVVAGDTLTGTGNREVLITSHVHMTCNGSAANCEGLGNQVTFNAGGVGNIFMLTSATTGSEANFNWVITNTNASAAMSTFPNSGGVDYKGTASSYTMATLFRPRACENVTGIRGGCICAEYSAHDTITVARCLNCYARDEGGAMWAYEIRGGGIFGTICTVDFNLTVACSTSGRGAIFYFAASTSNNIQLFGMANGMHYAPHVYGPTTNTSMLRTTYVGFSVYTEILGTFNGGTTNSPGILTLGIFGAVSGEPGQQRTLPLGLYEGFISSASGTASVVVPFTSGPSSNVATNQGLMMIVDGLCYGDDAIGCASQVNKTKPYLSTSLFGLNNGAMYLTVSNNIRVPSNGSNTLLYDECYNVNGGQQPVNNFDSAQNFFQRCFILDGDLPDGDGRATQPYPVDVGNDGIHETFGYYDPPFTSEGMCTTSILLLVDANCQNSTAVNSAVKSALLPQYVQQPVTIRYSTFRSDGLVDTESGFTPMDFYFDFDNDTISAQTTFTAHAILTDMLDYQGLNTTSPWAIVIANAWYQHEHYHAVPTFVFMITATGDSSAAASTVAARNAWSANGVTQFWGVHINSSVSSINITTDMNNLFGGNWTSTSNSTQEGIAAAITSIMGGRYCNSSAAVALGCTLPVNENQYRLGTDCISGRSICAKMQYNCTALACTTQNYTDQNDNTFSSSPWAGNPRSYDDRCLGWMVGTDPYTPLFPDPRSPLYGLYGSQGRYAQGICVATSAIAAPTCGFFRNAAQFYASLPHPDAVNEPQRIVGSTVVNDYAAERCVRQQVLRNPRSRTSQTYTYRGYWDNNNVLQQECVAMSDDCYRGIWEHRGCRHNFPASVAGNYTWDNTTNCAYVAVNEGGTCYRGECVSGAGVCNNGFCVGGTNNNSLCYDVYDYYTSWNLTICPTCTLCQNWTCDPSSIYSNDRGCVFNGNYTAGTSCAPANSCVTSATCDSRGSCNVNTVNNTVCDDGDGTTTDTCDVVVSKRANECKNCLSGLYGGCSDGNPGTTGDVTNGYGYCFPTLANCANVGTVSGPFAQGTNCTFSSAHICTNLGFFVGIAGNGSVGNGAYYNGFVGVPPAAPTPEWYCNLDVCNSNSFSRCNANTGLCDACAGPLLPACTAPRRSCLKLIGIVIDVETLKPVQTQFLLDALKAQIAIYAKERFVAISITIMTSGNAYPHCNYVDLSNSGTDDSMQKLMDCISTIPLTLGVYGTTGMWIYGLGVYDASVTKPDFIILLAYAKSYNYPNNNVIIANQLRGNGTTLYGIYLSCSFFRNSRSDEGLTNSNNLITDVQDFDATFGALDVNWFIASIPVGVLTGAKVDFEGNVTVALRKVFNLTMPNSCVGHNPPCTTASLNITTCTCSVSTNVSANGQVCGSNIPGFPLCQQGATCASGVCNTSSGSFVHTFCDDGFSNTTDTCAPTNGNATNDGCVHTLTTGFLDTCNSCQLSTTYKNGQTICPIRPGYTCGPLAYQYDFLPNICMRSIGYVFNGFSQNNIQTGVLNIQWPYWQNYPAAQNIFQRFSKKCYDPDGFTQIFTGTCDEYRCNGLNFTCTHLATPYTGPCYPAANQFPFPGGSVLYQPYSAMCLSAGMTDDAKCQGCIGQKCAPYWTEGVDTITGCTARNDTLYAQFFASCLAASPQIDSDCVTEVTCGTQSTSKDGFAVYPFRDGRTVQLNADVTLISGGCGFIINRGGTCCLGGTCFAGNGYPTGTCLRSGVCQPLATNAPNCDDGQRCTFDRCCPAESACTYQPLTDVTVITNSSIAYQNNGFMILGADRNNSVPSCGAWDSTSGAFSQGIPKFYQQYDPQFGPINARYHSFGPFAYSTTSNSVSNAQFFHSMVLDTKHLNSIIAGVSFNMFESWTVPTTTGSLFVFNPPLNASLTVVYSYRIGQTGTPIDMACVEMPSTTLTNITCASVANLTTDSIVTLLPYETILANTVSIGLPGGSDYESLAWSGLGQQILKYWPPVNFRIPVANLSATDTWLGIRVYSQKNTTFGFTPTVELVFDSGCPGNFNCSVTNVCIHGTCSAGLPPSCDDTNPCTNDFCNTATNQCVHQILTGSQCDVLGSCSVGATCNSSGVCTGGNHICASKPAVQCGSWKCGLTSTQTNTTSFASDLFQPLSFSGGITGNYNCLIGDITMPAISFSVTGATNTFATMGGYVGGAIAASGEGCPVIAGGFYLPEDEYGEINLGNATTDSFSSFSLDTNDAGTWLVEGDPYYTEVQARTYYTDTLYSNTPGDNLNFYPENHTNAQFRVPTWPYFYPQTDATGNFPFLSIPSIIMEKTLLMLGNYTYLPGGNYYFSRPGRITIYQMTNTPRNLAYGTTSPEMVYQRIQFPISDTPGTRALFGYSVSMSKDSTVIAASAPAYNGNEGRVWVFYYDNSTAKWLPTGTGTPLNFTGSSSPGSAGLQFGISVELSWDGQWLAVGAPGDNNNTGAVWIFTGSNNGSAWTQYGSKIVGTGGLGNPTCMGSAVDLSTDGTTLVFGGACPTITGPLFGGFNGTNDSGYSISVNSTNTGAVWVFERIAGTYVQNQVINGPSAPSNFGHELSMDAFGQTLIVADGIPIAIQSVTAYPMRRGIYMYFRDNFTDQFASFDFSGFGFNDYISLYTTADVSENGAVIAMRTVGRTTVAPFATHNPPTNPLTQLQRAQILIWQKTANVAACNAIFETGSCNYGSNATCAVGNCTAFDTCTMVVNNTACMGGPCMECNNFACDPFGVGANTTTGCNGMFYPDMTPCSTCFQDNITCTVQQCNSTHNCVTVPLDILCDDSDPCTLDSCNATTGCVHTPINGTGIVCAVNSTCNDNNSCTTDYCCGGRCLYVNNTGDYNGMCQVLGFNETFPSCPDCAACNNNSICEMFENAATCPNDCSNCTNDGVCGPMEGEQCFDCNDNPCIPDGVCGEGENRHNCDADCDNCNHDSVCDVFENAACSDCCGASCNMPGNGVCSACEGAAACTNDQICDCNPAICNLDGVCDFNENEACEDCLSTHCTPNGKCEVNENNHNCTEDCTGCVNDGMCEVYENASCIDCRIC